MTGVHDLDAYLHAQLLLAAITLTLTILERGGTAVYKVFLSPMDPRGEMLRSQLRGLFGGEGGEGGEVEIDMSEDELPRESGEEGGDVDMDVDAQEDTARQSHTEDTRRKNGVWMCKPRSSRQGSGGESIPPSYLILHTILKTSVHHYLPSCTYLHPPTCITLTPPQKHSSSAADSTPLSSLSPRRTLPLPWNTSVPRAPGLSLLIHSRTSLGTRILVLQAAAAMKPPVDRQGQGQLRGRDGQMIKRSDGKRSRDGWGVVI